MGIDWKELAKEKPPELGEYLVFHPYTKTVNVADWHEDREGYNYFQWEDDKDDCETVTHWAHLTPPGEISEDDRRFGELLVNVNTVLSSWDSLPWNDYGLVEIGPDELSGVIQKVHEALATRFGPDWEELLRENP